MIRHVHTAVIGAGSAGISALEQIKKSTDSFVLIDSGPLGSTCARVGCMPSKVLIHVANTYHQRHAFEQQGINGGAHVQCDVPAVLRHVRTLRDRFTSGMVEATRQLAGDGLVQGKAVLEGPQRIRVGELVIHAQRIIIATGATPFVPESWHAFGDRIITSETIFEQKDLPPRLAVIGLGAVGLELGQALSRLGVRVPGFTHSATIGGLQDPDVCAAAITQQRKEWDLYLGASVQVRDTKEGLVVSAGKTSILVDKILVAAGIRPNVQGLGLEALGIELDEHGMPPFDPRTMQVGDLPIFMAGDVNGHRAILHEAVDEGVIAGHNAIAASPECYCRRLPLRIVFCDPQLAAVGHSVAQLKGREFVTGSVDFEDQGRAIIEGANRGLLKLYVDPDSARLLGGEMACPHAEHLAHLLALALQQEATVFDLLRIPFYHPTFEEGLRTALQDAARQLPHGARETEISLCESCPESPLR